MISAVSILLAGFALVSAQWGAAPARPNPYQNMIVSHIAQDVTGNFGYATADGHSRTQSVAPDGSVRGSYSYIDAHGKPVKVDYVADQHGYRATGDNVPAHAQHVPAPTASSSGQWSGHGSARATGQWLGHAAYERPGASAAPIPYQHAPFGQPAPFAVQSPHAPVNTYNPAAEAQLAQTVQAHAANDQRAQQQQLQQLASITGGTGHHHAAHVPAAPSSGFFSFNNPFGFQG